ncbi:hypothetical protein GOODEAATRI_009117, partial [Goodea atripinnis]
IEKVQLPDMGSYRCAVQSEGNQTLSEEGRIQLEGLPHFSMEPRHMSIVANVSLSLRCVAHGPPEPVRVIWLQDLAPLNSLKDPVALSPSTLNLTGLNRTSTFSCEAHNQKGVATSGSGTVTGKHTLKNLCAEFPAVGYLSTLLFWCFWFPVVLPSPPRNVRAVEITQTALRLSWQPGFGGVYPIIRCSVQAKQLGDSFPADSNKMIHNQNVNIPPATHLIQDLKPHTLYSVRVACDSSQGPSDWSPWVELRTLEGVPENPPANVTARPNGTEVFVTWEEPLGKLNGELQGYMVEYSTPSTQQVSQENKHKGRLKAPNRIPHQFTETLGIKGHLHVNIPDCR